MNQSKKNTLDSSVFLDANVLLEIILGRPKDNVAREVVNSYPGRMHISGLTAHLAVHFGLTRVTLSTIRQFLSDYVILSLEEVDFEWAFDNTRSADFEDALQVAVALRYGCDTFITFDKNLHKSYSDMAPTINIKLLY